MFEYSCSATHLANWVMSQVTDQPGAVFPKRKGWSFFMKTFYPAGSEQSMLMVMTANNKECVVFLPVDEGVDEHQIRNALKPEVIRSLRKDFKQISYQAVIIAGERQQERVIRILEEKDLVCPLLVLSSETVRFVRGNFDNPRLEFRLSQLDYDPDLIPGLIHDGRLKGPANAGKSLFYQNFFHRMNRYWLNGERRIPLRRLVSKSIPCWSHYRRVDQNSIFQQVHSDLTIVFEQILGSVASFEMYRKKSNSQPEVILLLADPPQTKKDLSTWSRKQRLALAFLDESGKPLSIEELELFIN